MARYSDSRRHPKVMTPDEQKRLLRVTGDHKSGYRDHVLFSLALATGLREHEIVALDVEDVYDIERGRSRHRVTLRKFKGSDGEKTQEILLSTRIREKLDEYVKWLLTNRKGISQSLFASSRGSRLSTRQVRHAFAEWQKRAGFDRHLNFHSLRHTACSAIYRSTKDIMVTKQFARHKSIATTAVYSHPTEEDLERAVESI